jgi:hypothetical protein
MFHAVSGTQRWAAPTKSFSRSGEYTLKRTDGLMIPRQNEGGAMWNVIINLIYEQSCERYLSEAFSVEAQAREINLIEA